MKITITVEIPDDMDEAEVEWVCSRIYCRVMEAREVLSDPRLVCTAPERWNQLRDFRGVQIGELKAERS